MACHRELLLRSSSSHVRFIRLFHSRSLVLSRYGRGDNIAVHLSTFSPLSFLKSPLASVSLFRWSSRFFSFHGERRGIKKEEENHSAWLCGGVRETKEEIENIVSKRTVWCAPLSARERAVYRGVIWKCWSNISFRLDSAILLSASRRLPLLLLCSARLGSALLYPQTITGCWSGLGTLLYSSSWY